MTMQIERFPGSGLGSPQKESNDVVLSSEKTERNRGGHSLTLQMFELLGMHRVFRLTSNYRDTCGLTDKTDWTAISPSKKTWISSNEFNGTEIPPDPSSMVEIRTPLGWCRPCSLEQSQAWCQPPWWSRSFHGPGMRRAIKIVPSQIMSPKVQVKQKPKVCAHPTLHSENWISRSRPLDPLTLTGLHDSPWPCRTSGGPPVALCDPPGAPWW